MKADPEAFLQFTQWNVREPYRVGMKYWTYNRPRSTIYAYPFTAGPFNPKLAVPTLWRSFTISPFHIITR